MDLQENNRRWRGLFAPIGVLGTLGLTLEPAAGAASSPADLWAKMAEIAKATQGPVGAVAVVVEGGRIVALSGERRFPMQSVYKLPIAMALLQQIDVGTLRLDQHIQIRSGDLAPASRGSVIRDKYPNGTEMTVSEHLGAMMIVSDGTASDVLLTLVGGPERVTAYLRGRGIHDVVVATTERAMAQREQEQHRNWASPEGMASLLCAFQEGKGLSSSSRRLLLGLMNTSKTGPHQIKGLLPAETPVAHKTGSSGTVNGLTRATNDVGR